MKAAINKLKIIIPGLHEASTDLEVFEMTAKYIEFMRTFVDIEHDKQFLQSQILWKKNIVHVISPDLSLQNCELKSPT